ncbi:hypothetical protein OAU49_02725 [Alphaproteobacteria bacterium]|nr:hypothetical protein [Alphaproteobacteria bacterium]
MNKFIIISLLIFLSSCTTKLEHQNMLQSWVGHKETDILDAWGTPTKHYETAGVKYLTWSNNSSFVMPGNAYTTYGYGTATTSYTPSIPINLNCDITMIIKEGIIVSGKSKGNNCYDF